MCSSNLSQDHEDGGSRGFNHETFTLNDCWGMRKNLKNKSENINVPYCKKIEHMVSEATHGWGPGAAWFEAAPEL